METEALWLTIRSGISLLALGTMVGFMVARNVRQYQDAKIWNWARFFMIMSFFASALSHIILIGYHSLGIDGFESLIGTSITEPTVNTILITTTICFSSMFAAYINGWDSLVLLPLFIQIGALIFTFLIGTINFEYYYIMVFGVLSIIALWEAGIRLKDNMAMGIGIMSTLQLIASFGGFYFQTALSLIGITFGAITIMGLFRPYKEG